MTTDYRNYWDKNIDLWGEKYLDISHGHETFDRPAWFTAAYNATIGQLERRLMKERYRRTVAFLDEYIKPGVTFSDLGCGTGIFVVEAARRGAVVNAVDFSESALNSTRQAVERFTPDATVTYTKIDLQTGDIPESEVSLSMGVTPYMADIEAFICNAIPKTRILCLQFTDSRNWASRVRRAIPLIDVRALQCYSRQEIDATYRKCSGIVCEREKFASGFIDIVANAEHADCDLSKYQPDAYAAFGMA